jgi:hypothetical protein
MFVLLKVSSFCNEITKNIPQRPLLYSHASQTGRQKAEYGGGKGAVIKGE